MKSFVMKSFCASARWAVTAGTLVALVSLSGCGLGPAGSSKGTGSSTLTSHVIQGRVFGGQQPIVGATIQVYAAGSPVSGGGYGTGATPLLNTTVTTGDDGTFSITGLYTCPTPAVPVYVTATGGNPGLPGTVNNTGIALMAALGMCPAGSDLSGSISFANINEVSTVAAVWALQQFMAPPATVNVGAPNVGAPGTSYATGTSLGSIQSAVIGMDNAFVTASVMSDIATGLTPNTHYAYATPESSKINTIADILAYCVNSDPSITTYCNDLFTAATPAGSPAAADTIQAAWYIAQNPTHNLSTLVGYVTSEAPFHPTLSSLKDSTIAINYRPVQGANPAVGAAYNVAIDAFGNAWLSNGGGNGSSVGALELGVDGSALFPTVTSYTVSSTKGSTAQFDAGLPASHASTFVTPRGLAVDLANRAWITNYGEAATVKSGVTTSSIALFNGSTAAATKGTGGGTISTGYYVGLNPLGVAIDGNDNVFVANSVNASSARLDGSSIAKLISDPGQADDGTYTYSTSSDGTPPNSTAGSSTYLAVDTNGIVWANAGNGCKAVGQYSTPTPGTYFGTIGLYSASTLAPLNGSDIVSAYSNATVGGTECGTYTGQKVGTYTAQTISSPTANMFSAAIDRNNGAWFTDVYTSSTGFDGLTYIVAPNPATGVLPTPNSYYIADSPVPTSGNGSAGTTLNKAGAVAVDGNNNVWVGVQSSAAVVEAKLSGGVISFLTPVGGFGHSTYTSDGIAIDPSGNVWLTNTSTSASKTYTDQSGNPAIIGTSMTVVVGAAGPVVTPLALAVKSNKLGAKP